MHHHHTSVGTAVLELIIGLLITPAALYLIARVWKSEAGFKAGGSRINAFNADGWKWGAPVVVVVIGIILIVKGIVGL